VIILLAFIISVGAFLLGASPQAGAIIIPLLGGMIVYSLVCFFVAYPHFFSRIKIGPSGFEGDLREAREEAAAIEAEETRATKAEEPASEAKAEINEIQESDTSALGVFIQLSNEIETKLRIISELNGHSGYKYAPMGRYARELAEANIISPRLAELIGAFRSVRNEVVHSGDISRSELKDGIYIGQVILTELNKTLH
jgi:uncharacterized protein YutE (UPF0331/DUF86 family)